MNTDKDSKPSDVFLRIPLHICATLKKVAKKEERKITAVAIRALRHYFAKEHGITLDNEMST